MGTRSLLCHVHFNQSNKDFGHEAIFIAKINDLKNLFKLPMTKSRWFLQYWD